MEELENNCLVIKEEDIKTENEEITIENNTVLVYTEDGVETKYEPYAIENGQIILRRVEPETESLIENNEVYTIELDDQKIPKKVENISKNRFLTNKIPEKRKLSYENDFKPCSLPANRGGLKGFIRYGRKHLIIDQQTMISPREFKEQLNDYSDIVMRAEIAPVTKKQMSYVISGITRLFAYPAHKMPNNKLLKLYTNNCTTKKTQDEEKFTDMELKPLGFKTEIDTTKIKRITRKRKYPETENNFSNQSKTDDDEIIELRIDSENDLELIEAAKNAQSNDHGYTKSDSEVLKPESGQIYIMQSIDENGVLNNIEVLLAAAETSENISENETQNIYFVQEGSDQVICLPEEYIIS